MTGKEIHVHFETIIYIVSRKHKYLRLKPIFKVTAPLEINLLECPAARLIISLLTMQIYREAFTEKEKCKINT